MRTFVAILIILTSMTPAIAQYSACEGCHYIITPDFEVEWECHLTEFGSRTVCQEKTDGTGCDFYACCGRTYCETYWV